MRRIVVLVFVATLFVFVRATTALGQVMSSQASCDWYWDYTFNPSGGWEYWCWDPLLSQWYGTDGKNKIMSATFSD